MKNGKKKMKRMTTAARRKSNEEFKRENERLKDGNDEREM